MKTEGAKSDINQTIRINCLVSKLYLVILQYTCGNSVLVCLCVPPVEGLYCKRPIQCLASSEILTPHPLTARRVCTPPAFGAGGGHTRWVERGWGINS